MLRAINSVIRSNRVNCSASNIARNCVRLYASNNSSEFADNKPLLERVLIANRGEIACRIIKTARRLGISTVAVYSDADRNAQHVKLADEAVYIGPSPSSESYLMMDKIIDACIQTGAQAVHPGYGFLSENVNFCKKCSDANITFIGPSPYAIKAMGNKSESKALMEAAGVPLAPGYHGSDMSDENLLQQAKNIGWPLMIKAVAGGGGKGMRIVHSEDEFIDSLHSCRREALKSFGEDAVLIERYLNDPRHVELQVFGDTYGNVVYLMERDCSVQRRHQKVLEEAPAPGLDAETRRKFGEAAVAAAKAVGYVGAGTVEFLMDSTPGSKEFYFCEMNTRLQVEHPVTELITGQDLVEWQLRVASGQPLPLTQEQIYDRVRGCALEARIYAENPLNNFLPTSGKLLHVRTPNIPAEVVAKHNDGLGLASSKKSSIVRVDSGVVSGDTVSTYYDPMIAKLLVHAGSRAEALRAMRQALRNYQVCGIPNNITFLERCVATEEFSNSVTNTGFFSRNLNDIVDSLQPTPLKELSTEVRFGLVSYLESLKVHSEGTVWDGLESSLINWRNQRSRFSDMLISRDGEEPVEITIEHANDGNVNIFLSDASDKETFQCKVKSVKLCAQSNDHSVWENAIIVGDRAVTGTVVVSTDDTHSETNLDIWIDGRTGDELTHHQFKIPAIGSGNSTSSTGSSLTTALSPMPGRIIKLVVQDGEVVKQGDPIVVLEAMKMEHVVSAPCDGTVNIFCSEGATVANGAKLADITPTDSI